MKNNSINYSSCLTEREFKLVYDYYTYKTINEMNYKEEKNYLSVIKDKIKKNLKNILPEEMIRINQNSLIPCAFVYLNFFNFSDVIVKKSFYTNEIIKTIFFRIFNVDTKYSSLEPTWFFKNLLQIFKSLFAFNYNPKIFLTKSCVYGLSYFYFLYKFRFVDELKFKDWMELFVVSGICTIPFNLYLENILMKKYIIPDLLHKSEASFKYQGIQRSLLVSFKSFIENFFMLSGFFIIWQYFIQSEDRHNKNTLKNLENYDLFKESLETNETFSRLKNIYIKDEYITDIDYMLPLFYSTVIITMLYTPIDFCLNLIISMEKDTSFKTIYNKFTKNIQNPQDTNHTSFLMNSFKNNLRMNLYRFFLQYGITTYYIFNNVYKIQ